MRYTCQDYQRICTVSVCTIGRYNQHPPGSPRVKAPSLFTLPPFFSSFWFSQVILRLIQHISSSSAQGSARPTFALRDWVQDWNFQSLNFETGSETQIFWVSVSRPSPRLKFSESQFRDRVQDSNFLSLNFETESETVNFRVSVLRPSPRLTVSKSQYQDWVRD